jgi:cobalamin biosynthesis protein CobW
MSKIPVTVITGFLGAGKTTLLRHLLLNNQGKRIAVLVNEFGEVGIDGELLRSCQVCPEEEANSNIVELTNGCLCCTVQEEFFPTMLELLERRTSLDYIVIETSGLALPKPLVQAFRWPEIRHGATVDGVITVVDCDALARGQLVGDLDALLSQRQEDPNLEHETPLEELFEDQLACADLVLLTKTDLVPSPTLSDITTALTRLVRPGVKILPCAQGEINPEILLGFAAAVEENLATRPSHHDNEEEHEHDEDINSLQILLSQPVQPDLLLTQLKQLLENHEIYRIKGFISVPDKQMRMVLQGVGDRLETFYDRLWKPQELRQTQLVFIGRSLDAATLEKSLQVYL